MGRLSRFFSELKRRKVYRVAIAYVAVAFIGLQAVDLLIPATTLPDWVDEFLLAIAILGFPVAVVVAWAFELTPEGVRRTEPGEQQSEAEPESGRSGSAWGMALASLALLIAVAWYWLFSDSDDTAEQGRTVAVLPFQTLGLDQPDMFTDGMHVGVLTRLSNVGDFEVISRTSVLPYSEVGKSLPQIARELDADWVLRADVQQVSDQVLISARLADARLDRQVWAEEYRRTLTAHNVFELQAEVTRMIVQQLQARLTPSEQSLIGRIPTESLEAYRLYEQGRDLLDRRTAEHMRRSLGYFERAIGEDPGYALAWTGLADALGQLYAYGHESDPEMLERADNAVSKALELDGDLAEAHALKGFLHYTRHEGPAALRDIRRALEIRPSFAQALIWRAFISALLGDESEALNSAKRAVSLNPLSAEAAHNLSGAYSASGRDQEALDEARRGRELAPGWPNSRLVEGQALYYMGRIKDAIAVLEGVHVPWTGAGAETFLALCYIELGRMEDARRVLAQIEEIGDRYGVAVIHAALGSLDLGYRLLGDIEVWEEWPTLSYRYKHGDIWDPEGNDPRYREILDVVNSSWGYEPDSGGTGTTLR